MVGPGRITCRDCCGRSLSRHLRGKLVLLLPGTQLRSATTGVQPGGNKGQMMQGVVIVKAV